MNSKLHNPESSFRLTDLKNLLKLGQTCNCFSRLLSMNIIKFPSNLYRKPIANKTPTSKTLDSIIITLAYGAVSTMESKVVYVMFEVGSGGLNDYEEEKGVQNIKACV